MDAAAQPRPQLGSVPVGELRRALDDIVAEGLPLVTGVLAALFAIFSLVDPSIHPRPVGSQIAFWDAGCALIFFGGFLYVNRRGVPAGRAHLALLLVALVPIVDVLHNLYVVRDPAQTLYLLLVAVGGGSLMLSTLWLVPILVVTLGAWVAMALLVGDARWITFGFALFAACVVGVMIQRVRILTYRRIEVLRIGADHASAERDLREQALEAAVKSAWESEDRYRRLVEQAPDAFLVHTEGKVVYANSAAVKLLGAADAPALLGADVADLLPAPKPGDRELTARRLDGSSCDVEVTSQSISYLGKAADQTIIRDVTDRKRAEDEQRVAESRLAEISRLKELDKMKTQFVNTLSHELRTPLTPIKVQLHLLKAAHATGDKDKQQKAAVMLERNVQRMGGLIDELLEVARLQAGTLKLDMGPLELDATLAEALESFRDVARANGVAVETRFEPHLKIDGDPRRLTQVMYNLLNNALKFTPSGGQILVDAHHEGEDAVVRVTDTGIGIKAEDIQRLFEPFSQVHDTMQKTNSGTGLGLYICKGIVEGHGGTIWAESPGSGKGTTFAFTLPQGGR